MKHVLIIDDDADLRVVLGKVLRNAGYTVTDAGDGLQGLAQFDTVLPDLVITDLVMPVVEGIEVITSLRQKHPQIKIIAMSSGGQRGHAVYLQLAQKLGANRKLEKPFSLHDFLATVHAVLGD